MLEETRRTGRNPLLDWYRDDPASQACANLYSLTGRGTRDLFRDLIVLKAAQPDEKGVILLKYVRTFSAVVALFDIERLMERYIVVLEPCWVGYCDPAILMFVTRDQPVLVQCFWEEDHRFIVNIGPPLVPVRLGPADWVDSEVFDQASSTSRPYDLVMVANWARHKRHSLLFRAVAEIDDRDVRVLLVGFPWAQRTANDIRREMAEWPIARVHIEILESVTHSELAELLAQCKVFLFLSKKEGDNKALVEAMFADVPAIVYDKTVGGALSRINPATGILSSDERLSDSIRYMLDHCLEFAPRHWAMNNTGSKIATKILDDAIKHAVVASGGGYSESIVEKTNSPNLAYKLPHIRGRFQPDYDYVTSCRRPVV